MKKVGDAFAVHPIAAGFTHGHPISSANYVEDASDTINTDGSTMERVSIGQ